MELLGDYDYIVSYNTFDAVEECFFGSIIQLIINYPIIWYNFLENILKNKIMISFRNTAMIVSLELLTPQLKNAFYAVYNCMIKNGVVVKSIEKKGFLIIYLYNQKISDFFQNSGFWLEYITAYACSEIGFSCLRGALIKTRDMNIQEVDVLVDLGRVIFLIECKDTYNYTNSDLKKIFDLRKKINCHSYGIFVCSKAGINIDYHKYEIELIRYKYNYTKFKEQLKDVIANKIISLSF